MLLPFSKMLSWNSVLVFLLEFIILFFFLWATPTACGSSQGRDQAQDTAVTQAAAVTMLDSFIFLKMIFIFSIIADLQCSVNFLLHSEVTQLHIHVYILFSHIVMLHHKWPDIVPSAIQQDPIAYLFQSLLTPNSQSISLPTPPSWQPQVCSPCPWVSFPWEVSLLPYIRFHV